MAMGAIGSTAWVLVMTVTDPIPSKIPHWEPSVHLETEAKCKEIAKAINQKALVAGMKKQLSATCNKIEYVEVPEQIRNKPKP